MTDTTTLVDRYLDIWNERDAGRRAAMIGQTWTEDATYLDPLMRGERADGIDAMIAAVQTQFPGHEFRQIGKTDGHNDVVRFSWELVNTADGARLIAGTDVANVADDGRLRSVTGFLDGEL